MSHFYEWLWFDLVASHRIVASITQLQYSALHTLLYLQDISIQHYSHEVDSARNIPHTFWIVTCTLCYQYTSRLLLCSLVREYYVPWWYPPCQSPTCRVSYKSRWSLGSGAWRVFMLQILKFCLFSTA